MVECMHSGQKPQMWFPVQKEEEEEEEGEEEEQQQQQKKYSISFSLFLI